MQKIAQKRSLIDKLIEKTNISGIAAEKYFSPELQQVMDQLRNVDDGVRAIVSGESVGEASAPDDAVGMKDLLKPIKSNLRRREYIRAVADLSRFHDKCLQISHLLSLMKFNMDKIHERFLFQDMDDDTKKHLLSLKKRLNQKSASLQKKASITDFLVNIGTERGRALAAWEKRYPNRVKQLREDSDKIADASEKLISGILNVLKDMSSARSKRNPDNYVAASQKIIDAISKYDEAFRKFYQQNVQQFLEKQEFVLPTKTDVTNTPEQLGKQEVALSPENSAPVTPISPLKDTIKTGPPSGMNPSSIPPMPPIPSFKPKSSPIIVQRNTDPLAETMDDGREKDTLIDIKAPEFNEEELKKIKTSHRKFYNSLKFLSAESNQVLAHHICTYAKNILASDPETSLQLFKVAKTLKG